MEMTVVLMFPNFYETLEVMRVMVAHNPMPLQFTQPLRKSNFDQLPYLALPSNLVFLLLPFPVAPRIYYKVMVVIWYHCNSVLTLRI